MITPSDSPSSPSNYAAVPVSQVDIQAPQEDLSAAVEAAGAVAKGPRQFEAQTLLHGGDAPNVTAGYSGGGEWPIDPRP